MNFFDEFRDPDKAKGLLHGAVWGVDHTVTLIVVGTIVISTQSAVATSTAAVLEGCVGVMLVLLGIDVARRMLRGAVHLHVHEHPGGVRHFHAHSHTTPTDVHAHDHAGNERQRFPKRALFIGSMHGLAGSAALILLALRTTDSIGLGLLYMALFGLGSMIGMALLSALIAVPFNYSAKYLQRVQHCFQCAVSMSNIGLGTYVIAAAYSAV